MAVLGTQNLYTLWYNLPIRRRGAIIIAIPVTCLLTSVVAFARLQSINARSQENIDHTQQVLQQASRLLTVLVDAEAGVRGYALTYSAEYLESYKTSLTAIPESLNQLSRLVKDHPQQLKRFRKLQELSQRKIRSLKNNVARANAVRQGSASSFTLNPQSKVTMDAIRRQLREFRTAEEHSLTIHQQQLKTQQQFTLAILTTAATVGVLGALAAVYLFDRLDYELAERETRLCESNIRLQAILDNVVDGIMTINEQGHIESLNQAAQLMFGYPPSQVIGENLKLLLGYPVSGDSIQALTRFIGEDFAKIRHQQETIGRRRNGGMFPMEITFSKLRLDNQRLYIGVLRDITQRKQSEELERKQAQLLNLANDTIIVRDQDESITYWNQGAERLYGWRKEEVMGKSIHALLQTQFPQPYAEIQEIFLQYGYWKGELIHTQRNGKQITVASRWTLQLDEEGEPLATLEINNDITERKSAEKDLLDRANELARLSTILAQTNTDLEKRNQELDQFAYIVSHDLKAPLRAIANLSTWIEEDISSQLTPETKHQMDLLRGRVHRMEALINGILQYSRVGRVKTSAEWVNVKTLLMEVLDTLAPPPSFRLTIASGMPTLFTERLPLTQVFANLLGNAIKHHYRTEGQIQISVNDKEAFYEFVVADDGPGIAPQYHEKVFVIFQTLEARDKVENTGVGLAIVKKIVENQGGTIRIKSQVGHGTAFSFTWLKELKNIT